MQGTTQNYTLDMADGRKKEPLRVKQGDTNSRWARVTLRAFGELGPIPGDCLVFISVKKTDGTVVQNDCTIEGPGVVLVPIADRLRPLQGFSGRNYISWPRTGILNPRPSRSRSFQWSWTRK